MDILCRTCDTPGKVGYNFEFILGNRFIQDKRMNRKPPFSEQHRQDGLNSLDAVLFPSKKSSYLERIFDTHPCDTLSCLEMSHGLTPLWASSTILWRTTSGKGRPLTNTPPSWFTPPWPGSKKREKDIQSACHKFISYISRRHWILW